MACYRGVGRNPTTGAFFHRGTITTSAKFSPHFPRHESPYLTACLGRHCTMIITSNTAQNGSGSLRPRPRLRTFNEDTRVGPMQIYNAPLAKTHIFYVDTYQRTSFPEMAVLHVVTRSPQSAQRSGLARPSLLPVSLSAHYAPYVGSKPRAWQCSSLRIWQFNYQCRYTSRTSSVVFLRDFLTSAYV